MASGLAVLGILAGLVLACVPGVPGAVVALLALVAWATLGPGVPPSAMLLGVMFALTGALAQAVAPLWAIRAVSGSAGAATGAVVGVAIGLLVPLPLVSLGLGCLGAGVGALVAGPGLRSRVGALGVGCASLVVAVGVDLLAVLGIAAILGALAA